MNQLDRWPDRSASSHEGASAYFVGVLVWPCRFDMQRIMHHSRCFGGLVHSANPGQGSHFAAARFRLDRISSATCSKRLLRGLLIYGCCSASPDRSGSLSSAASLLRLNLLFACASR